MLFGGSMGITAGGAGMRRLGRAREGARTLTGINRGRDLGHGGRVVELVDGNGVLLVADVAFLMLLVVDVDLHVGSGRVVDGCCRRVDGGRVWV